MIEFNVSRIDNLITVIHNVNKIFAKYPKKRHHYSHFIDNFNHHYVAYAVVDGDWYSYDRDYQNQQTDILFRCMEHLFNENNLYIVGTPSLAEIEKAFKKYIVEYYTQ